MASRPSANNDGFVFRDGQPITGNLLTNDSDPDGDPLFLRFFDGVRVDAKGPGPHVTEIAGDYGTFLVQPDGSFTYALRPDVVLAPGESVTETLSAKISDGKGNTDVSRFSMTIEGGLTQTFDIDEDEILSGLLDSGAAGGTPTYAAGADGPDHGTVSIDADGGFTYTPDADWYGTDHFSYVVDDGSGGAAEGHATVNVAQLLDDPVISNATADVPNWSYRPDISADGSKIAFVKLRNDPLAPNVSTDVAYLDLTSGLFLVVTEDADQSSSAAVISPDGQTLAFATPSGSLVHSGDPFGYANVLFDVASKGFTVLPSSEDVVITHGPFSQDGSVLLTTITDYSQPGAKTDTYLYDLATGAFTNLTAAIPGDISAVDLSADGSFIVFNSEDALVAGDSNGTEDVFLYEVATGELINVTLGGDNYSRADDHAISADGRYLAFFSQASNLVDDDTNDELDVFLYDRLLGTTISVSQGGDDRSFVPALSADGSTLVFMSRASNLVADDINGADDIFRYDVVTGDLINITQAGNYASQDPVVSADGSVIAFASWADNLVPGDTDNGLDVFLYTLI